MLSNEILWFLSEIEIDYCFKCYLVSFSRYCGFTQYYAPKHAEQDQTDAKWLGKKLNFWRESRRVGRSLIIVNKSIKKKHRKFEFFQCKIKFYLTHEHQSVYFHVRHSWKYCI